MPLSVQEMWYALATACGEPKDIYDTKKISENRLYWNSYMANFLSDEEKKGQKSKKGVFLFPTNETLKSIDQVLRQLRKRNKDEAADRLELISLDTNADTEIDFSNFEFNRPVSFQGFYFFLKTTFDAATFNKSVDFYSAIFGKQVGFSNANFIENSNFSEAEFFLKTDFSECTFYQAPEFYDAKLFQNTDWRNIHWKLPVDPESKSISLPIVKDNIRAFEHLAYLMDTQNRPHDEHFFFRQEMRVRRLLDKDHLGVSFRIHQIYDEVCRYGYGVSRILLLWLGQMGVGAALIFSLTPINNCQLPLVEQLKNFGFAVAISVSNSHSFLGLKRNYLKNFTDWDTLKVDNYFNIIGYAQTILGVILFFFLLLTLRNRFRMR